MLLETLELRHQRLDPLEHGVEVSGETIEPPPRLIGRPSRDRQR